MYISSGGGPRLQEGEQLSDAVCAESVKASMKDTSSAAGSYNHVLVVSWLGIAFEAFKIPVSFPMRRHPNLALISEGASATDELPDCQRVLTMECVIISVSIPKLK